MRCLFEPRLVNDAFGDPTLYVAFRDERRALLFDLGDISALPPRRLLRLTHVFVTHAHMDHFGGFDHLLRVVLGRKDRLTLFGGPDFVAQVEHRLAALGVTTGPWLRELKHAVLSGAPGDTAITLRWRDRAGEHTMTRTVSELSDVVLDAMPGRRIGYVTDLRYSEPNIETLEQLLG